MALQYNGVDSPWEVELAAALGYGFADRADNENLPLSAFVLPVHAFRLDLDNNKVYVTELDLDESGAYLGEHVVEREIPEGVRFPEVRLASVSQNMQDDVLLMASRA